MKKISLEVSYSQIAVFVTGLSHPFNDWTDLHVAQGFAWRPGSVSFRTISEDGTHSIEVDVVDWLGVVHPDAVRVIEVPFNVPDDGAIEVGSIGETVPITLPSGQFLLRSEFFGRTVDERWRVRLVFARKDIPRFAVVRADSELSFSGELITFAQPAG